jgi:type I restriction enzyme S subunit
MTNDAFKDIEKLETDLWEAADNLRANSKLTSSDYFMPVLGVIFLRHAANRFEAARRQTEADQASGKMPKRKVLRLRFPGHEHSRITNGVPEGWERLPLGDRVTLNYGKAMRFEDRVEGAWPVYGSSGIVGMHEKALAAGPGIVVGRKGNVGSVYWSPRDYWPIDTVYFVGAETSNLWLYYALQHMHFISTDVAVPGLNRDFAYSRPLLVPETRIVRCFLETAVPLHEQMTKLDEMNQKLRAARDLLLPRLMSGQIAVSGGVRQFSLIA